MQYEYPVLASVLNRGPGGGGEGGKKICMGNML